MKKPLVHYLKRGVAACGLRSDHLRAGEPMTFGWPTCRKCLAIARADEAEAERRSLEPAESGRGLEALYDAEYDRLYPGD